MKYLKYGLSTFLFISLITILFIIVSSKSGLTYQEINRNSKQPGQILDLSDYHFEYIAYISPSYFDCYPDVYYTPEQFAAHQVDLVPALSSDMRNLAKEYCTLYLKIRLPEGQVYAFSTYSANYAQRLYINGIEYPSSGSPGTNREENVAGTNYYIAAFEPRDGLVEIIIHMSNFVHADGGGAMPLYLGYQWQVNQAYQSAQVRINIMVGCMMTVCLLFLGLFLFFPHKWHLLWFSLTCMAIAIRTLIVEQKTIMILFPDLSWELSIRMEYLVLIGLLIFLPMYIHYFFGRPLGRWLAVAEGLFGGAYALLIVFTAPVNFTRYLLYYQCGAIIIGIIMIIACIFNAVKKKVYRTAEHLLLLIAIIIFAGIAIPDVSRHSYGGVLHYEVSLTQAAMMIFIFINMLAQILGFFKAEGELERAKKAEQELEQERNLLDKLNKLKREYLDNITHEMKTPLSVMAGYAQLTQWQMQRGTVDSDTVENLKIVSSEAHRLAKMAEQLLNLSAGREGIGGISDLQLADICSQVAGLCKPLLQKNKNILIFESDEQDLLVKFHQDSMIQILLNLISNADRHTQGGTIHMSLCRQEAFAVITISDNGSGIEPEQLPSLFERGYSLDGRTGLGLAICKEMIENNGGEIKIQSNLGEGTVITIILPLCEIKKEEE